MPLISHSSYRPPCWLKNRHLQTIFPQTFRKVKHVQYTRERIATPDDDFLDLDWSASGRPGCAILLHGLEGHSRRCYMQGMAAALNRRGWDACAVNLRGCSGEPNRRLRFYHHGATDDVATVVSHVAARPYTSLALIGFSLGGNLILKYLGEKAYPHPAPLHCAVAFSTPCDLPECARHMAAPSNRMYTRRFLAMLHEKIRIKQAQFPGQLSDEGFEQIRTFKQFDDRYTAPIHGFSSAEDYWSKAASAQFLDAITVPSLLVNAADDPILSPGCFPYAAARKSAALFLEVPRHGGHVGFVSFNRSGEYWLETRAMEFLGDHARFSPG